MSQKTKPAYVSQNGDEDKRWGVDVSDQLVGAETVTFPVVRLTRGPTVIPLQDAPAIDGFVVRQRIRKGVLTQGTYRLIVLFTPSGTTNVHESVLTVVCMRDATPA